MSQLCAPVKQQLAENVPSELDHSCAGGGVSPVSTVTLSLHSIFEQLHANPQDICDI